jgi:hypothetical protein
MDGAWALYVFVGLSWVVVDDTCASHHSLNFYHFLTISFHFGSFSPYVHIRHDDDVVDEAHTQPNATHFNFHPSGELTRRLRPSVEPKYSVNDFFSESLL